MTAMSSRGVCVVGRADFETGIGSVTHSALELFSRSTDVVFFAARGRSAAPYVTLASGRVVPTVESPEGFAVYFFTDVLWNGVRDENYRMVPDSGFRIAHVAYDSDAMPPEWVIILNERFDLMLGMSTHLEDVARSSGVTIPVGTLPLGLDLEPLLSARYSPPAVKVRFGTLSAFHERKGLDVLVDAFIETFGASEDVELVVHSNLAMGDVYSRVTDRVERSGVTNVILSHGNLSVQGKNSLLRSFDVYVNASGGEGYSIGPREAMALGLPLVLSDIPAHQDLSGVPGVFLVTPSHRVPARYPEIDNRVFGTQVQFNRRTIGAALKEARDFALSPVADFTSHSRKSRAAQFSLTTTEKDYRELVDPTAPKSGRPGSLYTSRPEVIRPQASAAAARHGRSVGRRKVVIPAHDGGFFSLFNVFASHLVWSMQESSPPIVLPDWDVERLIARSGGTLPESYCYSTPTDGNMWLSLFEPLYDLADDDLNDVEFLYGGSEIPAARFNERKEPLLTYSNAYSLYKAPWFARFRTQYNTVVRDKVRLRRHHQNEIDAFSARLSGRFSVAAHVKHPSHSIEQPGGAIVARQGYVSEVRAALASEGIREGSDDWMVFLATDQDRVVALFDNEFGDHVVRFDDVARIDVTTDERFDELAPDQQLVTGHQVQHILASNTSAWSTRLAWEVWRDAEAMAASDVLIHAVSNVATAVSYLGPSVRMVFAEPK